MHKLLNALNSMASNVSDALIWTKSFCVVLAIIAGLLLPFMFNLTRQERQDAPVWRKLLNLFTLCCFLFGSISPLTFYLLGYMLPNLQNKEITSVLLWSMLIICTVIGFIIHLCLRRFIEPEIQNIKHKAIKKTKLERDVRTDVRKIKDLLPVTIKYDPLQYIDLSKGVFIGLNDAEKPQYIPLEDWQKQHADIIGTTGAGKGVATAILLYQSIIADEGVFVLDPKDDEWAPHLYREACRAAGKPFALIDLRSKKYQVDLLEGTNSETLEELLNAGFSLAEKGEGADFYRLGDRRASRHVSELYESGMTLRDLFNTEYIRSIQEDVANFHAKMEEISLLNSVNARGGLSLKDTFDKGGCVYIIGSMRNPKIISAQRMILVRLLQIAEARDRIKSKPRPIAIFLDELKYHLSRPALEGLGAARDKGVHIIMAHQSLGDLEDCPADLKPKAVIGAVVENTKFKLVYRVQDPATAKWVAEMSGSILVDDESRKVKTNAVLVETVEGDRMIKQSERFYVDTNMLLNLPDFVSFIFTNKHLPRASMISPIKVAKKALVIFEADEKKQTEITPVINFSETPPLVPLNEKPIELVEERDQQNHDNADDDFAAFKLTEEDDAFFKVDS